MKTQSSPKKINKENPVTFSPKDAEFLSTLSHDIKTPLNAITGLAVLLGKTETLSEKQEKFISTLKQSADHLLGLINELFEFLNIENAATPVSHNPTIAGAKRATIKQPKILLVEDYEANILVATTMIESFGYEYDVAQDGLEALKKFNKSEYSVILMDVHMKDMDGLETVQRIREIEKEEGLTHTPVIAVTAQTSVDDWDKFLKAGMDDYIAKPFNPGLFERKLKYYIK